MPPHPTPVCVGSARSPEELLDSCPDWVGSGGPVAGPQFQERNLASWGPPLGRLPVQGCPVVIERLSFTLMEDKFRALGHPLSTTTPWAGAELWVQATVLIALCPQPLAPKGGVG